MPPRLGPAFRLGVRAALHEPWLIAVGLGVALLRRAAVWPALLVAWAVIVRSALAAAARHPLWPLAPLQGALDAATSPRLLALVAGLWLVGVAVGAALRVAYVAGALPTLGGALAGFPGPRFAAGVAFGFPRVLAASALGAVLEVSGGLFGATLVLAAGRVTASAAATGGSPLLAAAVALALVVAIAVPLALSIVVDAAVARAAVAGDGPAQAFVESGGRFLARPGTYLLATMIFGAAAAIVPGLVAGAGSLATGFLSVASPALLAGPELMLAVAAAAVSAGIDLVQLGTIAALACAEDG